MADAEAGPSSSAKTPADFLKSIKGKPVVVKLNSGVDYRGELLRGRLALCVGPTALRLRLLCSAPEGALRAPPCEGCSICAAR